MKIITIYIIACLLFAGCAGTGPAKTPGSEIMRSEVDNSFDIYQVPVNATNSPTEGYHLMGMRWNSKTKDIVYLTAAAQIKRNITGLSFDIDGETITASPASNFTDFDDCSYFSSKQFTVPFEEFVKLSNAKEVKYKIRYDINSYSYSFFGKNKTNAIINYKFDDFIQKVRLNM